MSRTIFLYIFKDLIRIFVLASAALAGIMSFGGLLRPLTEHGLDAAQASKMLSYFMPAMATYSLPVAALFATTMVYGRLAADNELTACRAAGISYFSIALPALVMGFLVAMISLLFLCFIVPVFTLKVERVIYSNLAQLIANQIERKHHIRFQDTTIFAQEAAVAQHDPNNPREQVVILGGLMIARTERVDAGGTRLHVPREFYLARRADTFIRRERNDEFTIQARLEDGYMFPRQFSGRQSSQAGLHATNYGPVVISSLIKEDTKFMDVRRLHELYNDFGQSRRVQEQMQAIIRERQESEFLKRVQAQLATTGARAHFDAGSEQYELVTRDGAKLAGGKLIVGAGRFVQIRDQREYLTADAAEIELKAHALSGDRLAVQVELRDVVVQTGDGPSPRPGTLRSFVVPATVSHEELARHGPAHYRFDEQVSYDHRIALRRELIRIANAVMSEMHARASFAVSCLILVVVGCWLGMMFKSGNFLSAFAVSVLPALLSIALIVAGQQTSMNIPYRLDDDFQNPLRLGLGLIWSGNAAALVLAVVLGARLQRQ